jgi:hypothetical protein
MGAPNKPATTPSLPGAKSTRTDGGIADKQVIQQLTGWNPSDTDTNASFSKIESSAPMAATTGAKGMTPSQIGAAVGQQQPQQGQTGLMQSNLQSAPQTVTNASSSFPSTLDPTEALARALYAMNPTENLRRVVSQFDKDIG